MLTLYIYMCIPKFITIVMPRSDNYTVDSSITSTSSTSTDTSANSNNSISVINITRIL